MVLEILNPWRSPNDDFEPHPLAALLLQAPVKLLLHRLYHILTSLRSQPRPSQPPIRVVCLSDTHTHFPHDVPAGDILIHAGDMTSAGSVAEIQAQIDWLCALPHREIVVIAGNHDTYLDPRTRSSLSAAQREGSLDWGRVHYLQHKLLTLTLTPDPVSQDTEGERVPLLGSSSNGKRTLRIYGAPQIPACGPMSVHAFQYPRGSDAWSETVPEDVDILVTHTPPKYHLDLSMPRGLGCEHLLRELERVKPALHVFGHVHWGAGVEVLHWDRAHEAYVKGMGTESRYTRGVLNPRLWWNVVRVAYRGVRELLWDRVWGGQSEGTILVNAALTKGNTGKLGNPVRVVDI
ncbi:hypothetical protein N0V87_001277 [Didymella glomerata]|uniref:Calcineurin-like phosphoesterase domain-containing protein n=1 Tax=Didymella glomerata TaxID=749621 RepID=A0A9W9C3L4_9PLEO|nr:hypothetical protein N0V87_001277 [Didymella glomerata]